MAPLEELKFVFSTVLVLIQLELMKLSTTGGGGTATFNFNELYKSGQAGFAVLDIYVGGVLVGIIKIEEEKTSEETVII